LSFRLENSTANAEIDTLSLHDALPIYEAQGPGTNVIRVIVSDDGRPSLSATQSFTVVVLESNRAPELPEQVDVTLLELSTLTVTNRKSEPLNPANMLTSYVVFCLNEAS